jgi:tRNA pseudouridine55 synthase
MGLPKTYRATAKLGWTSDSGDRDGVLEHTGRMPAELRIPPGEQLQRPPAYSAVKVGGERLYKKARRGEAVEGEPRPVTVHRADLLHHHGDAATFEIECSSGTYVRSLISDLGDAYCEALERTAIGSFALADAHPERILPANAALAFLPERPLSDAEAAAVSHGVPVPAADAGREGAVRLTHGDALIALAEPRGHDLQPVVVFSA